MVAVRYFRPRFFGAGLACGSSGSTDSLSASESGSRLGAGASACLDRLGFDSPSGSMSTNLIAITPW